MSKKVISLREILILFGIGIVAVIIGSVLDWNISSPLFPMSQNPFNSIVAALASVITSMIVMFACTILVINPPKQTGFKVFSIIAGVIAGLGAIYGNIVNVLDMYRYAKITDGFWLETILIVICVICDVFPVILAFFAVKKLDKQRLFNVSFVIFIIFAAAFLTQTAFKYLASRPRPRACFLDGYRPAKHGFRAWYEWKPFDCLNHETQDYYKSFFSGHTINAALLCMMLPLTTRYTTKYQNDRPLQVVLFYTGLLYTLFIGFSRIWAGAHWLSDVGFAIIFAAAIMFIVQWIVNKTPIKEATNEKQNS